VDGPSLDAVRIDWKDIFGSTGGSAGGWEVFIGEIEAFVGGWGVPGAEWGRFEAWDAFCGEEDAVLGPEIAFTTSWAIFEVGEDSRDKSCNCCWE
jgi:hypothetical protein